MSEFFVMSKVSIKLGKEGAQGIEIRWFDGKDRRTLYSEEDLSRDLILKLGHVVELVENDVGIDDAFLALSLAVEYDKEGVLTAKIGGYIDLDTNSSFRWQWSGMVFKQAHIDLITAVKVAAEEFVKSKPQQMDLFEEDEEEEDSNKEFDEVLDKVAS